MGSSKKQTTGYRYYMGLHFGVCHGPVDAIKDVVVGERLAWTGSQTASGSIAVIAPELFGGDKREGGIEGILDVAMGEPAQATNSYLATMLGSGIPAFRGILSLVWQGGLVTSNNPYVKPWAFRVERILQGWAGGSAWYSAKAKISAQDCGISATTTLVDVGSAWNYLVVPYADTSDHIGEAEVSGLGPFANALPHPASNSPFLQSGGTTVSRIDTLWMERVVICVAGSTIDLVVKADNDQTVFINGVQITPHTIDGWVCSYTFVSQNSYFIVTIKVVESEPLNDTSSNYKYADAYITQSPKAQGFDMNPAHIIYQCLTDTAWGMGYPTGAIDNASFIAAADTLYAETFGLSMMWNQQDTIESFIAIVLDHIAGMLYVRPDTGTFALKLIRADYDRGTLPQYGVTNLISADDYQRQAWGETINEISVIYTDSCSGKEQSVTIQDAANIITQGAVVSQTRNYSGIPNASLAQRVAQRDLNAASTPLARIKLTATRAAWAVFPGDVFRLTWAEYGIADVVYRALNVNLGTLQDGQIIIDAVEDVFAMPSNTYLVDQPSEWEDPSSAPASAPYSELIEAPYWDLVRNLSAADMAYVDPLAGYLETLAVRPSGDAVNYSIYAKTGGADYTERGTGNFCPSATVVETLTKTTTSITLANGIDISLVSSGGYAVIESEYVLISAINWIAGTATISRGVLDTVPVDHVAGSRIWFADGWQGYDPTEAADTEVVDVKLLPITGQGELALVAATADSITFDQRQYRPYAPGKLLVNGSIYPEWIEGHLGVSFTWSHRDRLAQTAYIVTQDEDSIGPEAGVAYNLRIYGETNLLLHTESELAASSYDYTTANELSDLGGSVVEEPFWSSVALLLNMNGVDNGTTFTDVTGKTVTANGNAKTVTATKKFGTASAYFDGAGDYLSVPSNSDFNFGTGEFTIECWINISTSTTYQVFISRQTESPTPGIALQLRQSATGTLEVILRESSVIFTITGTIPLGTGSWKHIAVTRDSGNMVRLFVNGIKNGELSCTYNITSTDRPLGVGALLGGSGWPSSYFTGYIDDLRITKGVARYTSDFDPPGELSRYISSSRINGLLRFELEAVRGGLVSYQKHNHTVLREGYGFNYGYYYGGQ